MIMNLTMDKPSVLRAVVWVISAINMILTHYGKSVIPSDFWAPIIADGIFLALSAYVGYKNNYLAARGKLQKQALVSKGLYRPNK
jgi:SPP1 family holin